jgi:outer membrane lipoprotein
MEEPTMKPLLLLFISFVLSGCAHVISDEGLRLVDRSISFRTVRENPTHYIGKYIVAGGTIAAVRNSKEGAELEVVQLNLDRTGMPEDNIRSDGRFIAISPDFLDSMIYSNGKMVTILGEISGQKTKKLEERDYSYPVLTIKEIHLWRSFDQERGYPYPIPAPYGFYDPYYYNYWPGPYWYRPFGPYYRW